MPSLSPSHLPEEAAAAAVANKFTVIDKMAEAMREIDAGRGCCTIDDLKLRGFTATQIELYADDARAIALTRSNRRIPQANTLRASGTLASNA